MSIHVDASSDTSHLYRYRKLYRYRSSYTDTGGYIAIPGACINIAGYIDRGGPSIDTGGYIDTGGLYWYRKLYRYSHTKLMAFTFYLGMVSTKANPCRKFDWSRSQSFKV